jgi:hypothetical protein
MAPREDETMSLTTDLDATEPTIAWPDSANDAPDGWHWGRHVSLGALGTGYYLICDADGATCIAIQRPDLDADDAPSEEEIRSAIASDPEA